MNEHLQKVANDLQQVYDMYRNRVDAYEDSFNATNEAHDAYRAAKPGWENPLRIAIPMVGAGVGMATGARLGRRQYAELPGAYAGGLVGMGAGMLGQHGVRAALDHQNPIRRDLREKKDAELNNNARDLELLQRSMETVKREGVRNPAGLYPMLQPRDEYDGMIESDIHAALLREQRLAEERAELENEALRAGIAKDQSKANKNNHFVNNSGQ